MDHFWQIGGFRPDIQWWRTTDYDDKKLVEDLAGRDSPLWPQGQGAIELVLGIKPTGTSHMLLSEQQVTNLVRASNRKREYPRRSYRAYNFESLSPIYFHTKEAFKETFNRLKPKYIKNREPWDNSQENKAFSSDKKHPERGAFEHGRLFYHIIKGSIDHRKFSLHDVSWAKSAQVYSFAFSLRSPDTRSHDERTSHPSLLDCGLAQATLPDFQYKDASAVHISFYNNRMLGAGCPKLAFNHGKTDELDDLATSARLKDFFSKTVYNGSTVGSVPIILLVHNAEVAMNALKDLGVDTTGWKLGLKDLVCDQAIQGDYRDYRQSGASRDHQNDRYSRGGYGRERSRSPSRVSSNHETIPSSSTQRSNFPPVYIVDLKVIFIALMQSAVASEKVTCIAGPKGLGLEDSNGWCAGNDAVTMIRIWHDMISGASIDQQRMLRNKSRDTNAPIGVGTSSATPGADSEFDPRTIVLPTTSAVDYDSDSDYGESD